MIFFFGSAWFTWYSVNHKITHATRPTLYVPWVQRMRFSVMLRFIFKYCVDCFCGEQKEFCVRFKQTTKMQIILQTKQIVIWWNILSVDHLPFSHLLHFSDRSQPDDKMTRQKRANKDKNAILMWGFRWFHAIWFSQNTKFNPSETHVRGLSEFSVSPATARAHGINMLIWDGEKKRS